MATMTTGRIEYKGHSYIKVVGNAHVPARFWEYVLLTTAEYAALEPPQQADYRRITEADLGLIQKAGM